jgi:hypothetical protein
MKRKSSFRHLHRTIVELPNVLTGDPVVSGGWSWNSATRTATGAAATSEIAWSGKLTPGVLYNFSLESNMSAGDELRFVTKAGAGIVYTTINLPLGPNVLVGTFTAEAGIGTDFIVQADGATYTGTAKFRVWPA